MTIQKKKLLSQTIVMTSRDTVAPQNGQGSCGAPMWINMHAIVQDMHM